MTWGSVIIKLTLDITYRDNIGLWNLDKSSQALKPLCGSYKPPQAGVKGKVTLQKYDLELF